MMPIIFILVAITLFSVVFLLNYWIVKFSMKKAVNKIVIPKLQDKNLTLNRYQWAGLFAPVEFKKDIKITSASSTGSAS
jgi:hypothetical protein